MRLPYVAQLGVGGRPRCLEVDGRTRRRALRGRAQEVVHGAAAGPVKDAEPRPLIPLPLGRCGWGVMVGTFVVRLGVAEGLRHPAFFKRSTLS